MHHTPGQPAPLPPFERSSEAVVFLYLEARCQEEGGSCRLSLADLARCCRLSMRTIQRVVVRLDNLGWISYQPGKNQYWPTRFALPSTGPPRPKTGVVDNSSLPRRASFPARTPGREEKLSPRRSAVAKSALDNPSDKYDTRINILYLYKSDREVLHRKTRQVEENPFRVGENLAWRIANSLNDLKNLALYHSYCRRFSLQTVLKAYLRALAPPDEKIRVSRGALFNHLCQHYAQRTKHDDN